MKAIELNNVSFHYPNNPIFKNISAKFSTGEKIALLGENGTGKTTLLKMMSTLLKPNDGVIQHLDETYEMDKHNIRRQIGVCLEDSHLLRNFTVVENLRIYQKLYTDVYEPEKIYAWLEKFRMQLYRETLIQHLSQGEQKKISLIKAFLHEPPVLLLDEPTNSLDQDSKNALSEIFKSLDGRLLIVSTHDREWSKQWSTREINIQKGELS
jgi:ABC-type multidrug transport system ATPase subunit